MEEVKDILCYEICLKRTLVQEDTGNSVQSKTDFADYIFKEKYEEICKILNEK